jgi:hypothetical protein
VLLVSGLKLVNVPTTAIGIVLLLSVTGLLAAWVTVRVSGRTLREIAGEPGRKASTPAGLSLDTEEAA